MAAGPKRIAQEFQGTDDLMKNGVRQMRSRVEQFIHALGYAPGCDLLPGDSWRDLYDGFKALETQLDRLDTILQYAIAESPEGRAEEVAARKAAE